MGIKNSLIIVKKMSSLNNSGRLLYYLILNFAGSEQAVETSTLPDPGVVCLLCPSSTEGSSYITSAVLVIYSLNSTRSIYFTWLGSQYTRCRLPLLLENTDIWQLRNLVIHYYNGNKWRIKESTIRGQRKNLSPSWDSNPRPSVF